MILRVFPSRAWSASLANQHPRIDPTGPLHTTPFKSSPTTHTATHNSVLIATLPICIHSGAMVHSCDERASGGVVHMCPLNFHPESADVEPKTSPPVLTHVC